MASHFLQFCIAQWQLTEQLHTVGDSSPSTPLPQSLSYDHIIGRGGPQRDPILRLNIGHRPKSSVIADSGLCDASALQTWQTNNDYLTKHSNTAGGSGGNTLMYIYMHTSDTRVTARLQALDVCM